MFSSNNPLVVHNQSVVGGTVNPLYRQTLVKVLNIDTKFHEQNKRGCDLGDTTYLVELPYSIKNVINMKLSTIEIPNTAYVFDELSNTNSLEVKIGGDIYKIEIPGGNYDAESVVTAIQEHPNWPPTLNILYDVDRNKIKISSDKFFSLFFPENKHKLKSGKMCYNLGWIFGYRKLSYMGDKSYEGEGCFDTTGSRYYLLVLDDFQKNSENFYINGSLEESALVKANVLGRISLSNVKQSIGFDENNNSIPKKRTYFGPISLEKIEFKILDEYGNNVKLNNMDYSFTLELECLYK